MIPPDDTPPKWLGAFGTTVYADRAHVTDDVMFVLAQANVAKTLPEWLAWRGRVAEALGLMEPPKPNPVSKALKEMVDELGPDAVIAAIEEDVEEMSRRFNQHRSDVMGASVRKAIAAELRRLADAWPPQSMTLAEVYARLRHRADELDPR